ncbi:NRIP3 protein, partial [Nothocercus julius]|nr:NRIP3 protein [Nothocercus julius]
MFCSGVLAGPSGKDAELREAAALRQQRRVKQAVRFIHKDSADLLPLDGLKKLGTSKDTVRFVLLLRTWQSPGAVALRGMRDAGASARAPASPQPLVDSKLPSAAPAAPSRDGHRPCAGKALKAVVDTGSQFNLMSSACLHRLGLSEHLKAFSSDAERVSPPQGARALGRVDGLVLALGAVSVECAALVVEDSEKPFSLGLQTLKSLKCIINMEKQHLVLGQAERAEIPFVEGDAAAEH